MTGGYSAALSVSGPFLNSLIFPLGGETGSETCLGGDMP